MVFSLSINVYIVVFHFNEACERKQKEYIAFFESNKKPFSISLCLHQWKKMIFDED